MSFGNPNMIPVMVVTEILLVIFLAWAWKKRIDHTARFVRPRLLASLSVGISQGRRIFRLGLLVAATGCLLFALARPQTVRGFREQFETSIDLMVAVDVSRSMLAEDIVPNRLGYAQRQIEELASLPIRSRLGLIAFSGEALILCPLTRDRDVFERNLASLKAGMIGPGGTSLAACIRQAMSAFEEHSPHHRALLIFSDFEDHEGDAMTATSMATNLRVQVFTVGIGTSAGAPIPVVTNGNVRLLEDREGQRVTSQLDSTLLQQVAIAGLGEYYVLEGTNDMGRLITRLTDKIELERRRAANRGHQEIRAVPMVTEHYPLPLVIGMFLLLLEMFVPERILPRRPKSPSPLLPIQTLFFLGAVMVVPLLQASPQSALRLYRSGQFEAALNEYVRLHQEYPKDDRIVFNAGSAAYQAGRFAEAVQWFEQSRNSTRHLLNQKSAYNLGNCYYRLGQSETNLYRRLIQWNQAVQHFDEALRLQPGDEDARQNRQFLVEKLMELQLQLPQPPNNDSPANSSNNSLNTPGDSSQPSPASTTQSLTNHVRSEKSTNSQPVQNKPASSVNSSNLTDYPMTEEAVMRLLEAHRKSERAMPIESRPATPLKNSQLKDW